jgi:hypothetical protein
MDNGADAFYRAAAIATTVVVGTVALATGAIPVSVTTAIATCAVGLAGAVVVGSLRG